MCRMTMPKMHRTTQQSLYYGTHCLFSQEISQGQALRERLDLSTVSPNASVRRIISASSGRKIILVAKRSRLPKKTQTKTSARTGGGAALATKWHVVHVFIYYCASSHHTFCAEHHHYGTSKSLRRVHWNACAQQPCMQAKRGQRCFRITSYRSVRVRHEIGSENRIKKKQAYSRKDWT